MKQVYNTVRKSKGAWISPSVFIFLQIYQYDNGVAGGVCPPAAFFVVSKFGKAKLPINIKGDGGRAHSC